jgi:hypothetical protein
LGEDEGDFGGECPCEEEFGGESAGRCVRQGVIEVVR